MQICTELMQGGPYNATYVGGFALLTPAHRLVILSRNNSSILQGEGLGGSAPGTRVA